MRWKITRLQSSQVLQALYFFHRALLQNLQLQLISWSVEHQRSMGLVKAVRQRHRRTAATLLDIWACALT
ncbi:MAG: hypothetical protein V7K47_25565 [Nostoc sp.]